jgi:putative Mg2+ transporter-C (MgtC) family protein
MDAVEIALRLGIATVAGVLLGVNRDLHDKPTGVRTLGLVGLASALIVMAAGRESADISRVMQGIVTGIGFLGAGVIIRSERGKHIHNLTTAASVWLTACAGAASGAGQWALVLIATPFALMILIGGGRFEKLIHRHMPESEESAVDQR